MRAVVRAYSPIQKQFTIDPSKTHAWMEKKDHNEEIRNTLKDIHGHGQPAAAMGAQSSLLSSANSKKQHKQRGLQKPAVNSFMTSPLTTKKKTSRVTSSELRQRHFENDIANNNSSVIGPDSSELEESKCSIDSLSFLFSPQNLVWQNLLSVTSSNALWGSLCTHPVEKRYFFEVSGGEGYVWESRLRRRSPRNDRLCVLTTGVRE